jgi:hypothetical protein
MKYKDIAWYAGFIMGAACTGLLMKFFAVEVHPILRLVIIVGAGVGLGWFAESALNKER